MSQTKNQPRLSALMTALIPLIYASGYAHANTDAIPQVAMTTDATAETAKKDVLKLENTVVTGVFAQEKGTQLITNDDIRTRPTGNGTITDLLTENLNVQFSNSADSSQTPGEIAPENVSFHGEPFYNNNWMIDGMSNNDTVNPGANDGSTVVKNPDGFRPWDLPAGGTQSFWINSDIIEEAVVYDSNVSAKYGEFTGGVVDAKLKDPDTLKASGNVEWRTTRDDWTEYQLEEGNEEDFNKAESTIEQPQFTKNIYSLNLNQPLTDKASMLFSYNRTESKIPFHHEYLNKWENQERLSETYVLKGKYEADSGDDFKVTAMYSPHDSTYVKPNIENGRFTNKGGGYRLNGEWVHRFPEGKVTSYIGYKDTQNEIDSEGAAYYNWRASDSFDFVSNKSGSRVIIGGYGNFETGNKTITTKQNYTLKPMKLGNTVHSFNLGWQADWAKAHYKRDQDTALYSNTRLDANTVCQAGDATCIDGEQYFTRRQLYQAKNIEVNNNHYSAYVEDKINYKNLEITPGLRVQNNSFLKNVDLSPRLSASYDVFGNDKTQVFGGVNRYHSGNMLAYKLREATGRGLDQRRSSPDAAWTTSRELYSPSRRFVQPTDLDTPYSDEVNLGVQQQLGNSMWTLKWVNRKGKDQFTRGAIDIDGVTYRTLNNNGKSKSDTFSLQANMIKPYKFNHASVNVTGGVNYSKTEKNFGIYDDALDSDDLEERIIYQGKLLGRDETPAQDYNNPWRAFVNVNTFVPAWNMNWSQNFKYTAGYTNWDTDRVNCATDDNPACGSFTGRATEFTKKEFSNAFTMDWRFKFDIPTVKDQSFEVNVDVLNLLNKRAEAKNPANKTTAYKRGRQYWLGLRYNW